LFYATKLENKANILLVETDDPHYIFEQKLTKDILYKFAFCTRQLMQRLVAEGLIVIFMTVAIYFLEKKKLSTRQIEDTR